MARPSSSVQRGIRLQQERQKGITTVPEVAEYLSAKTRLAQTIFPEKRGAALEKNRIKAKLSSIKEFKY